MQRSKRQNAPLRRLAGLAAGAIALWILLACAAAQGGQNRTVHSFVAPADTDSVTLHQLDSLRALVMRLGRDSVRQMALGLGLDSLLLARIDSLAAPDTSHRARRYLTHLRRTGRAASIFQWQRRSIGADVFNGWQHEVTLDSTGQFYTARETVAGEDVRYPVRYDRAQFRAEKMEASLDRNWRELINRKQNQRLRQRRGGLGLSISVPGGRQSGFTTIFGKNTVDLRVNGSADIRPGFDYQKSAQQIAIGKDSRLYPDFEMDLRLGVTGTIGDKMQVSVDWDTNRDFDFQNQLKLIYTGYEDEIIQSIEAGNVFLQTPSSLIRGGQSLFGLKSEVQIGAFRLTTVASQQEGESNSLSLEGGAETTEFSRRPTDYNERKHYFLSYYFRNRWEEALSEPPNILLDAVFSHITDLEVWKLTPVAPEEQNVRQVVAMVDLGEPMQLVGLADAYVDPLRPHPDLDQYDAQELATELRPGAAVPKDYLESEVMDAPLRSVDFQVGQFKKLVLGRDYDLDDALGYITLRQTIQESEALAVSFRYLSGGTEIQVGDFSSQTGGGDNSQIGERLVLKLLKPVNLQQPANLGRPDELNPAAWYLEMRNIYELSRGLLPTEFVLDIGFEPPGRASTQTLPGVTGQATLIQVLGLDRLNEDGAPQPDNLFDFLPNYTVEAGNGLLIFPYLEPFGQRMESLVDASGLNDEDKAAAKQLYVFNNLYTQKRINAARNTRKNVYRIEGSHKGGIPSFYDLKAYSGLVEGSVRVTSGGAPLAENVDYIVDYLGGTVNIINPALQVAGRDIEIEFEENALVSLQKKTLLGARMEYAPNPRVAAGGTIMRMTQKSLTDKFRIGDEPISNTIWGVDGKLNLEPRWLTRAIDLLPLIQTKEPSRITVTGEFAQLRPGHTLTNAFKDERRDLRKDGRDFYPDEVDGISYVDDFEGFENLLSLSRPGAWLLSSAPVVGLDDEGGGPETALTNDGRGAMGWYQLSTSSLEQFEGQLVPAVQLVTPQQVFPNRETLQGERVLATLDFHFSPHERGPYNYNRDLGAFLDDPQRAWGGMTQRLSEGNTDFTSKNIEFVEFVMRPFPEAGDGDLNARLVVDIGRISEDVIPDNKLNTEDGLSLSDVGSVGTLARLSTGQQNQVINPIDASERITEDLGLDGLPSFRDNKFEREGGAGTEQVVFADFLASLDQTTSVRFPEYLARERAKALLDPSGDDYYYFLDQTFFGNSQLYPGGATVQQRFSHFFAGHELNTFESQRELAASGDGQGNTRIPDSEDINLNSASDTDNSYYQYEVPLNLTRLDELASPDRTDDFIINEIVKADGTGTGWYLVRIPLINYTRRVGGIQDFTLMESIRVWTTGHSAPITVRFATLELVGSQWRTSEAVNSADVNDDMLPADNPLTGPRISIESINNEENPNYEIPQGAVRSRIREPQSGTVRDAREQSMVLRVRNLEHDRQLAVYRTYPTPSDLLRYRNLRMFVHLDGFVDELPMQTQDRGLVKLFVRLGANETTDYYEYEQPLTPSPLDMVPEESSQRADYLWQTNQPNPDQNAEQAFVDLNSLNIELSTLNQLKFVRDTYVDEAGDPFDPIETFWSNEFGSLQETVDTFAPPGARIGVRGTPSLARVNTIVIGLRSGAGEEQIITDANVWINELRVSGYDEESGVAALLNADLKLADLGRVKGTARAQTDGFGSLTSTLGDRQQVNIRDWTVNTQLNMDNFIPERFGWSLPVSMEIKDNSSIPRFDPNRGDVRVTSLIDAIAADSTLTQEEIDTRQQEISEQAQTYSRTSSYTARLGKTGSRSALLRYTLDGINASYSLSNTTGRSPTQTQRDTWRWNTTLGYRLSIRSAKVLRMFSWLDGVPVLGMLSDIGLNYLPSSIDYNLTARRSFSETRQRPDPVRQRASDLPVDVQFPTRPQHKFSHGRRFGLQYSPFGFLSLSMESNTDQSLNAIGVDTLFSVILVDELGEESRMDDTSLADLLNAGTIDSTDIGVRAFELAGLSPVKADRALGRALGGPVEGAPGVRPESYTSRFQASFRPRLQRFQALNWVQFQDFSYGANYSWRNGSVGSNTGARATTSVTLRAGLTLRPQSVVEKFDFYKSLQAAERAAESARLQRRQTRQAERRQRLEERRRQREAARADTTAGTDALPADEDEEDGVVRPRPGIAAAESDTTARRGVQLPAVLAPKTLLRKLLLAVTGIQDVAVTYTGSRNSASSNVGSLDEDGNVVVHYSLRDALLNGQGPSFRYRLGLDRTIRPDQGRIITDRLQVTDAISVSDRYSGRTSLNPSSKLRINLNWTLESSDRENLTYRLFEDGLPGADTTQTGDRRASVWAFGASYAGMFEGQLNQFQADCGPDCFESGVFADTLRSPVLTNRFVFEGFQTNYMTGGSSGLLPFPLPGWSVSYTGISDWPLIRAVARNATLRHAYSADYSADFRSNLRRGQEDTFKLGAGPAIAFAVPDLEVDAVRINERYSPLVGVTLSIAGGMQTGMEWNKSNTYSLSTTNNVVTESRTNEITITASYATSNLKLPFIRSRLSNRINFSISLSRLVNDERSFYVRRAIERAIFDTEFTTEMALEEPFVDVLTSTARLQAQPKVSYQFSNVVTADMFVVYEDFIGDSRRLPYTSIKGGFNLRVNFSH